MSEAVSKPSQTSTGSKVEPRASIRENVVGLPGEDDIMAKTDDDGPDFDAIGSNTEKLSDITDEDEPNNARKTKKHTFYTWYKPIQPLVKNRRVRFFSFMNLLFFLINVCLLIALLILIIFIVVMQTQIYTYRKYPKPCLYEWNAWSECSKECRDPNDSSPPVRNRTIKKNTIVRARGKFEQSAPCPDNLENLVDYAPCNTYLCPQNLSSFNFSGASYSMNGKCYHIRQIPKADMQIRIDVDTLTKDCN